MTTFVDAKNLQQVTNAFDEIALQVIPFRVITLTPLLSSWPGSIPKGSHVRCIGNSRGAVNGVGIGDICDRDW